MEGPVVYTEHGATTLNPDDPGLNDSDLRSSIANTRRTAPITC